MELLLWAEPQTLNSNPPTNSESIWAFYKNRAFDLWIIVKTREMVTKRCRGGTVVQTWRTTDIICRLKWINDELNEGGAETHTHTHRLLAAEMPRWGSRCLPEGSFTMVGTFVLATSNMAASAIASAASCPMLPLFDKSSSTTLNKEETLHFQ